MTDAAKIIVAVDDDPFILDMVTRFLTAKGCRVVGTTDPERVAALAAAEKPDMIITDLAMPGLDGLTLLKQLKDNTSTHDIPLVILTSSEDADDEKASFSKGAEAYMHKPVDWEHDWPKIQAILTRK
jgi:PleD family two-component response regulator